MLTSLILFQAFIVQQFGFFFIEQKNATHTKLQKNDKNNENNENKWLARRWDAEDGNRSFRHFGGNGINSLFDSQCEFTISNTHAHWRLSKRYDHMNYFNWRQSKITSKAHVHTHTQSVEMKAKSLTSVQFGAPWNREQLYPPYWIINYEFFSPLHKYLMKRHFRLDDGCFISRAFATFIWYARNAARNNVAHTHTHTLNNICTYQME